MSTGSLSEPSYDSHKKGERDKSHYVDSLERLIKLNQNNYKE
jgi:hypothetical protein